VFTKIIQILQFEDNIYEFTRNIHELSQNGLALNNNTVLYYLKINNKLFNQMADVVLYNISINKENLVNKVFFKLTSLLVLKNKS